jgi:predicted dehydrogenase
MSVPYNPVSRREAMAHRPLRVGVIGLGFGQYHIRGYQRCPGVQVVAACSRTAETVRRIAQEHAIPHALTDYRELLGMAEVDAVSICTPVYLHRQMALEALEAGKHVLCEKPLALDAGQAQEMLEGARRAERVHMTNFGWRFNAPAFHAKSLIDSGYLGQIYHVNARYMMGYRADPKVPYGWRDRRTEGGFGALGDLGVHLIDMVRWWIGDFERVCALMRNLVPERPVPGKRDRRSSELEDTCAFLAELKDGVQGVFHASRCAIRSDYIHIDVHGNQGTLNFQFQRETMQARLFGAQGLNGEYRALPLPAHLSPPSPQQHFVKAIRSKGAAEPSFYEGFRVQQVADALIESADRLAWVDVPRSDA